MKLAVGKQDRWGKKIWQHLFPASRPFPMQRQCQNKAWVYFWEALQFLTKWLGNKDGGEIQYFFFFFGWTEWNDMEVSKWQPWENLHEFTWIIRHGTSVLYSLVILVHRMLHDREIIAPYWLSALVLCKLMSIHLDRNVCKRVMAGDKSVFSNFFHSLLYDYKHPTCALIILRNQHFKDARR